MLKLSLFLLFSFVGASLAQNDKVVFCYYSSWGWEREGNGQYLVENIDPFLCTHVAYAFASMNNVTYEVEPEDPDFDPPNYELFNALKLQNPELKTLLSVGGWGDGSYKYSEMVTEYDRRRAFVLSAKQIIQDYGFDGIDMDWEYPGGRPGEEQGLPNDKENFALFLQELSEEFYFDNLLVTGAISGGKGVIDVGYDIQILSASMDLINLMSYDYHGWWYGHNYTGHNSPLYPTPPETVEGHPGYMLNQDWSVQYLLSQGIRADELVLGLATYGRGFILEDPANSGLYANAVAPVPPGKYTNESSYWGYNEFCERQVVDGEEWTKYRESDAMIPYSVMDDMWFGFDDIESITVKSNYIVEQGLAGAMVWSIDTDDFLGTCGDGPYPLLSTMNQVLRPGRKSNKN